MAKAFIGPAGRLFCDSPAGWTLWAVDNVTGVGAKLAEGDGPLERARTDADNPGDGKTLCLTPKA